MKQEPSLASPWASIKVKLPNGVELRENLPRRIKHRKAQRVAQAVYGPEEIHRSENIDTF
jgi:hypothetical protein